MTISIYLAGPFNEQARLSTIKTQMEEWGEIAITSRWLSQETECSSFSGKEARNHALMDLEDIAKADLLVVVGGVSTTGGYHHEMGFKAGLDHGYDRIAFFGLPSSIFHSLAGLMTSSIMELHDWISAYKRQEGVRRAIELSYGVKPCR